LLHNLHFQAESRSQGLLPLSPSPYKHSSTLGGGGLVVLCADVDLKLPLNERELANSIVTDSRDCICCDVFHARREGEVELKNGGMPLHFLSPIGLAGIHKESERVWLLTTFLILLHASRNLVKNNLLKNQLAVASNRAKTIWIEALEKGDTTINR
jgi:hypothetical protein